MKPRLRSLFFLSFLLVYVWLLTTMTFGCFLGRRACKNSKDPAVCGGYVCNPRSLLCETTCTTNSSCDTARGYTCGKGTCNCSPDPVPDKTCKTSADCKSDKRLDHTCIAGKCYPGCNVICEKGDDCNKSDFLKKALGDDQKKSPKELGFACLNPTSNEEVGGSGAAAGGGIASLPGQGPKGICMIKADDLGGGGGGGLPGDDAGTGLPGDDAGTGTPGDDAGTGTPGDDAGTGTPGDDAGTD